MTSRGKVRGVVAGVAVSAALFAIPTGASAATTVGETFLSGQICPDGRTFLQTTSPNDQYAVPSPGVITSWSFRAVHPQGADPPRLKFKVGRPAGGNDYTIVGESAVVTPAADQLNTYPISIPVQAGDVIGFYTATSGPCATFTDGFLARFINDDVPPGETRTFTAGEGRKLDVSASLETQKCKGSAPTMAGTSGDDTLVGTPGKDVIVGFAGKDKIKGLGGKDKLCGLKGKDKLKGGGGKDKLKGGKGRDRLVGGGGRDKCVGGKGDDIAKKCEVERSI